MQHFKDKRILITGACGTVGLQLVRVLLDEQENSPAAVIGLDNNESELFYLDQHYADDARAHFYVTDIRDRGSLGHRMHNVDIVFHTAALKHVVLCERSPYDAVQTNIHGVHNIIAAAEDAGVSTVIFTSSDKVVNPTNVMGTSKLMGERLMTAAAGRQSDGGPVFASTRFGNVLGSNGSVVPVFHRQIARGGPVTLTDPRMLRFAMSVEQSVQLILDSAQVARGGEVFVTKMPVIRIEDLASVMVRELAAVYGHQPGQVPIEVIGIKPGEKLCEELMSREETRRAVELSRYYVILPAFRGGGSNIDYHYDTIISSKVDTPYVSADEPAMSQDELATFLRDHGLLHPHAFDPDRVHQTPTAVAQA